jgi:hypothetical protein
MRRYRFLSDKSKKYSLTKHAIAQARLRYGIELSKSDLAHVKHQIQSGISVFLERTSLNRTVHRVTIKEKSLIAVWDKQRSCVITFLPPDAREGQGDSVPQ